MVSRRNQRYSIREVLMVGGRAGTGAGGGKERSPRRVRFDPRLIIGIGLVVASVVGVYGVVQATDRSVPVYATIGALSPGDRVYVGDLEVATVRLGSAENRYIGKGDVPSEGLLVTRAVSAGELLPASAVGSAASVRVASVVVTASGQLSQSIAPGVVVDVWSAAQAEDRRFGPPAVLVGSATVVRVLESSGLIADHRGGGVEILVPKDRIARVLEAVADGDAISMVPVSIPVRR
ncbi:MAG: hypothetical protein KF739_00485 [Cryobacterium sp.]|nr:hypothetical protein [Cryobacterium sp.]